MATRRSQKRACSADSILARCRSISRKTSCAISSARPRSPVMRQASENTMDWCSSTSCSKSGCQIALGHIMSLLLFLSAVGSPLPADRVDFAATDSNEPVPEALASCTINLAATLLLRKEAVRGDAESYANGGTSSQWWLRTGRGCCGRRSGWARLCKAVSMVAGASVLMPYFLIQLVHGGEQSGAALLRRPGPRRG